MSYTIDVQNKIRKVVCRGSLASQDLPELMEKLHAVRERSPQAMAILADLTGLSEIEIDISSLENFATGLLRLTLPENFKIAFVANNLIQYSYAESFKILLDQPHIEVQVFRSERDAHTWLSEQGEL